MTGYAAPIDDPFDNALLGADRVSRTLDAAVRLYPFVSAVLPLDEAAAAQFKVAAGSEVSENDVARALRCVEIVFGMEAAIRHRLQVEDADAKLKAHDEAERR